jgi:NIPSNAP
LKRRRFLTSSFATTAAITAEARLAKAQSTQAGNTTAGNKQREYYELRRYHLESGPQTKLTNTYLEEALIPGLNRLGMKPIGVFNLEIGVETPSIYVLIPSNSLETLVRSEFRLREDDQYMKAGEAFLSAPAKEPAYTRVESSLMIAFEGWPKLILPPVSGKEGKRVFELRTYESPSNADHVRKVEMFHSGEFGAFERAGFWQVFFGDVLIGPRLPKLTYMLGFPDLSERNAKWKAFQSDPEWKKLTGSSRFNYESIVSNVTNVMIAPTAYSQV